MLPSTKRMHNQEWLPDVFNDFFDTNWMEHSNATAPAINVLDNDNCYDIELAAPGMTKEDFKVSINNDGDLVLDMEKKQECNNEEKKHGHYLRREFSYSKFQQTMLLPEDADTEKINAKVENGVLKVNIPKIRRANVENANKMIEIQ